MDTYHRPLSVKTEEMDTYHRFVNDGKDAARQANMSKSLGLFKLAHDIHPNEKLHSVIKKQEAIEVMAQQGSESSDEEFVNVNNSGLLLLRELYDKLYDHQKAGVAFLYGLYRDGKKGGILADDMGLGKTIQVISFVSGMYDAELVKHCLLVMPTSLIKIWTREFAKWAPGMRVKEFHGAKTERNKNLEKIQREGGVLITTYQMQILNWQMLASHNGKEFKWDYVILDEAHKIKIPKTKTAKSARAVPASNRVLLTGTPVQNNLKEMWALFDFACQGSLLGTSKTFNTEYGKPITRAREKDATPSEKALGLRISENLMTIIKPYFLRRRKADVGCKKENAATASQNDLESDEKESKVRNHNGAIMPALTRKNDLIIWTYLSKSQESIYTQFIFLDHIKELLMTSRSPLVELIVLKKLCDHPRLLSARAIAQLGLEEGTSANQDENECAANRIDNVSDETLISESGKLVFLFALLERLREEGHRTLVFSQSRKMLDIIERILVNKRFKMLRVDGTVIDLAERERRISLFQTNKKYSVFLLTTQVGGVGLTLTAADRVVIFDPSWNPATDAQAVDRAYRIGQTENVVVYRLITCGTVEEKIYRRQVFKSSITRQTTGDQKNPFRYFSKDELRELFTLQDTRSSSTQIQLQSMHSSQRRTDIQLDEHIACLHTMEMFGISDHDLMFSREVDHQEDAPEDQKAHRYIENRIQKAQDLMKAESMLNKQLGYSVDPIPEPAWWQIPSEQDDSDDSNDSIPEPAWWQKPSEQDDSDDSNDSIPEPAWWRTPAEQNTMASTERNPKKARPSHSVLNNPWVDLTESGLGDENDVENLSDAVDLTVDESEDDEPTSPDWSEEKLQKINHVYDLEQSQEEASTSYKARKSLAGNTSVPSKRSLEESGIVDVGDLDEDMPVVKLNEFSYPSVDISDSEEDEELPSFLDCGWNEPPFKARKRFGGITSVASRHHLVEPVIEDLEDLDNDMEDEVSNEFSDNVSNGRGKTESQNESKVEDEPSGEMPGTENDFKSDDGGRESHGESLMEDEPSGEMPGTENDDKSETGGSESLVEEDGPSGETQGTEKDDESEVDVSKCEGTEIKEDFVTLEKAETIEI